MLLTLGWSAEKGTVLKENTPKQIQTYIVDVIKVAREPKVWLFNGREEKRDLKHSKIKDANAKWAIYGKYILKTILKSLGVNAAKKKKEIKLLIINKNNSLNNKTK